MKTVIKKMCLLAAVAALCLGLTACGALKYKKAEKLFVEGNYAEALELYIAAGDHADAQEKANTCKYEVAVSFMEQEQYQDAVLLFFELGDFRDAKEQLARCEREIGMREKADHQFLEDIELSVNTRNKLVNDTDDKLTYLSAELTILEKYETESFYDSNLKALAKKYIEGLKEQKESLDLKYSEAQIKWHSGVVKRYQALCELHSDYRIFEDDIEFKSIYVSQLEYWEEQLEAMIAIDEDLNKQLDGITFGYKDYYTMTAPYTNNTGFDFSVEFIFTFYDREDVRVDESREVIPEIRSGDKCTLEFWRPSGWYRCDFYWELFNISRH